MLPYYHNVTLCYHILPKLYSFDHLNQLVFHKNRRPEEVPSLENLARPATPLRPPEDPSRLGGFPPGRDVEPMAEAAPDIATVELVAVVKPLAFQGTATSDRGLKCF